MATNRTYIIRNFPSEGDGLVVADVCSCDKTYLRIWCEGKRTYDTVNVSCSERGC